VGSWGGTGSTVYTYGNSSLRGGVAALSPKQGTVVQNSPGGWSHDVYTLTPGIPGDSGSGFLGASGGAIGVLSTVQLAPLAGSNGVGDLPKEIAYLKANAAGFSGANLVPGTQPALSRTSLTRRSASAFSSRGTLRIDQPPIPSSALPTSAWRGLSLGCFTLYSPLT
jgi:hypothetical protein